MTFPLFEAFTVSFTCSSSSTVNRRTIGNYTRLMANSVKSDHHAAYILYKKSKSSEIPMDHFSPFPVLTGRHREIVDCPSVQLRFEKEGQDKPAGKFQIFSTVCWLHLPSNILDPSMTNEEILALLYRVIPGRGSVRRPPPKRSIIFYALVRDEAVYFALFSSVTLGAESRDSRKFVFYASSMFDFILRYLW